MLAVINCKQLVTLAGPLRPRVGAEMRDLSIIADGAMLVLNERIEKVGTRRQIEHLIGAKCTVVDAGVVLSCQALSTPTLIPSSPARGPMNSKNVLRARLIKR